MDGMDGRGQPSTPTEFHLKVFKEYAECIKDAIAKTAKKTGQYDSPAIMDILVYQLQSFRYLKCSLISLEPWLMGFEEVMWDDFISQRGTEASMRP